jgi:acetyltransferase-like isoleucine patch superfamily enzyme
MEGMLVKDYMSNDELAALGLQSLGERVYIHRTALIANPQILRIGSDVRIDAFTIITCGEVPCAIGDHVHISTHVLVAGRAGFDIRSYVGLSSGSKVFTTSDDFAGEFLTGPTFPPEKTDVQAARVCFGEHAVCGANSVIIPGGILGEGAILGTLSLAKSPLEPWYIHAGIPARPVKARSKNLLRFID